MFRMQHLKVIAAFTVLAGAGPMAGAQPAAATGRDGGITTMNFRHIAVGAQEPARAANAKSSASASASASASSSGGADRGECRTRAESSAQARSGDEYVTDHDRDEKVTKDGACSARAESRAQAGGGSKRD